MFDCEALALIAILKEYFHHYYIKFHERLPGKNPLVEGDFNHGDLTLEPKKSIFSFSQDCTEETCHHANRITSIEKELYALIHEEIHFPSSEINPYYQVSFALSHIFVSYNINFVQRSLPKSPTPNLRFLHRARQTVQSGWQYSYQLLEKNNLRLKTQISPCLFSSRSEAIIFLLNNYFITFSKSKDLQNLLIEASSINDRDSNRSDFEFFKDKLVFQMNNL